MRISIGLLQAIIAVAICAIAIAMHLVEFPVTSMAARELVNALHAPGFGVVAVSMLILFRQANGPQLAYSWAFALSILLALAAEAAQIIGPRGTSVGDLGWDLVGISGFLALAACVDSRARRNLSTSGLALLLVVGVTATGAAVGPVAQDARVLISRARAMPVIASFDHSWEAGIYRSSAPTQLSIVEPPAEWPIQDGKIIAVDLAPIRYSGVTIDAFPNWSGFNSLSFLAASTDGKTHELVIRIHDAEHNQEYGDRFNRNFTIGPNAVRYRITLEDIRHGVSAREFDVSRVAGIVVFKVDATGNERLLFDDFRLE